MPVYAHPICSLGLQLLEDLLRLNFRSQSHVDGGIFPDGEELKSAIRDVFIGAPGSAVSLKG